MIMVAVLSLGIPTAAQDDTSPAELPLLREGWHLGTTFYGSGDMPQEAALADVMAQAADQGMTAFTFYVDWALLEPEPGVYDLRNVEASLAWLQELGIQPLLNVSFIDIEDLTLPADLLNEEGTALVDGLTFDDPQVVARLTGLLDELVPLLLAHDGFLLLLGNEVDAHFASFPTADYAAYARLIDLAREHTHRIAPDLAVGVTLTGTEVLAEGEVFQALRPVTDIIPFNFYPIAWEGLDWFTLMEPGEVRATLARFTEIYGDSPIVIQELGCPSGAANRSSPQAQAACFRVLFEALRDTPSVRYVTIFTLFDWDERTCDTVVELFNITDEELPGVFLERWEDYLCTLGLLDADYAPKPAWEVFLEYLP